MNVDSIISNLKLAIELFSREPRIPEDYIAASWAALAASGPWVDVVKQTVELGAREDLPWLAAEEIPLQLSTLLGIIESRRGFELHDLGQISKLVYSCMCLLVDLEKTVPAQLTADQVIATMAR